MASLRACSFTVKALARSSAARAHALASVAAASPSTSSSRAFTSTSARAAPPQDDQSLLGSIKQAAEGIKETVSDAVNTVQDTLEGSSSSGPTASSSSSSASPFPSLSKDPSIEELDRLISALRSKTDLDKKVITITVPSKEDSRAPKVEGSEEPLPAPTRETFYLDVHSQKLLAGLKRSLKESPILPASLVRDPSLPPFNPYLNPETGEITETLQPLHLPKKQANHMDTLRRTDYRTFKALYAKLLEVQTNPAAYPQAEVVDPNAGFPQLPHVAALKAAHQARLEAAREKAGENDVVLVETERVVPRSKHILKLERKELAEELGLDTSAEGWEFSHELGVLAKPPIKNQPKRTVNLETRPTPPLVRIKGVQREKIQNRGVPWKTGEERKHEKIQKLLQGRA